MSKEHWLIKLNESELQELKQRTLSNLPKSAELNGLAYIRQFTAEYNKYMYEKYKIKIVE